MDNQAFELRRLGLRQMMGQEQFIELYDQELSSLLEEVKADPDEDRRRAQTERLKTDGKHQIAYLMSLYMAGLQRGEDKEEVEQCQS